MATVRRRTRRAELRQVLVESQLESDMSQYISVHVTVRCIRPRQMPPELSPVLGESGAQEPFHVSHHRPDGEDRIQSAGWFKP